MMMGVWVPKHNLLLGQGHSRPASTFLFTLPHSHTAHSRVIHILSRRTKNNPVILGEPGVGKVRQQQQHKHFLWWYRQQQQHKHFLWWYCLSCTERALPLFPPSQAKAVLVLRLVHTSTHTHIWRVQTALVEGLAQRIAAGDVPETLRDVSVVALDMGLLMAGVCVCAPTFEGISTTCYARSSTKLSTKWPVGAEVCVPLPGRVSTRHP